MKFFTGKKGLAVTYGTFFAFFLFFSIPIGGIFYTLNDGDTFTKLTQIMGSAPTEINHAAGQFRMAFYFIIFMALLTGFMYLLTAKSRAFAFRFFTIIFGTYTIIAFGYKVIVGAALNTAIAKLDAGALKDGAPAIAKSFTNNFLILGVAGAALSMIALVIGLLGKEERES